MSFVLGFPFIHVQSANANGSAFFGLPGSCAPMATAASRDGSVATELVFEVAATEVDSPAAAAVTSLALPARPCRGAALLRPMSARSPELALFVFRFAAIEPFATASPLL